MHAGRLSAATARVTRIAVVVPAGSGLPR